MRREKMAGGRRKSLGSQVAGYTGPVAVDFIQLGVEVTEVYLLGEQVSSCLGFRNITDNVVGRVDSSRKTGETGRPSRRLL